MSHPEQNSEQSIMANLAQIMEDNRQRRDNRANTAFRTLRPYERRILKEAAVMGYVLGRQDGMIRGRQGGLDDSETYPMDFDIVQQVLEHCDSNSDLYPYLGDAAAGRRRRITGSRRWPGEGKADEQQ